MHSFSSTPSRFSERCVSLSQASAQVIVAVLALLASAVPTPAQEKAATPTSDAQWKQLFNGKNLEGWIPKIRGYALGENFGNTFRVEDGVLKVAYDAYEKFDSRFGHLFYETEFANYRLRVEYRFVGDQVPGGPGWAFRNSGLMLHGQPAKSMAKDKDFPDSIEVQLLGGRPRGNRPTLNLCTPGTHVVMDGKLLKRHCTNSESKTYRGDGWVSAEVEVRGDTFKHIAEGETVLEYTKPQLDDGTRLHAGSISLQSESHPIEFRKVEILELPSPAIDLLPEGPLSQYWHTEGNWNLGDDGVVKLVPREGERGWRRFDAYLWLAGSYRDFEIEFDYMVQRRGNSGFYFHVGDEKRPVATGIEVQIFDSHPKGKDRRLTDHDSGGVIPGLPPKKNAARPAGEWNHFRIRCEGDKFVVELNGVVVNEMRLDHPKIKDRPPTGIIGFQDHGLPLALRKIRIRRL